MRLSIPSTIGLRLTMISAAALLALSAGAGQVAAESYGGYCCSTWGADCVSENDTACAQGGFYFDYWSADDCDEVCIGDTLCGNGEPDKGECGPQGTCLEDCGDYKTCPEYDSQGDCEGASGCYWYDYFGDTFCEDEGYFCGDGYCDDGRDDTPDFEEDEENCHTDCAERCGNGTIEGDEECDDGGTEDGDGCDSYCREELCGNGRVDAYEYCDPGSGYDYDTGFAYEASAYCNIYCDWSWCGDGIEDSGYDEVNESYFEEECDDGNNENGDGCAYDCTLEYCGNGIIDIIDQSTGEEEECDDGGNDDGDGCSGSCTEEYCGNGIIDASGAGEDYSEPEDCDDWYYDETIDWWWGDSEYCDEDCTYAECGDGYLNKDAGEECDDGNTDEYDGCSPTCELEFCGDGYWDTTYDPDNGDYYDEECDDGNDVSGDGCSEWCTLEACGNGETDEGEECDPYNGWYDENGDQIDGTTGDQYEAADSDVGCTLYCTYSYCGDSIVNEYDDEDCDPGFGGSEVPFFDIDDSSDCNFDCTEVYCGDGYVNEAAGEQCDDGLKCADGSDCTWSDSCDDGSVCQKLYGYGCDQDCQLEDDAQVVCCTDFDYDNFYYIWTASEGQTKSECEDDLWGYAEPISEEDQDSDLSSEQEDSYCGYVGACCYDSDEDGTNDDVYASTYDDCFGDYVPARDTDSDGDGDLSKTELREACELVLVDEYVCKDEGNGTEPRGDDPYEVNTNPDIEAYVADGVLYVTRDPNDPYCKPVYLDDDPCTPTSFAQANINEENFHPQRAYCPL